MLVSIYIRNIALVQQLELNFQNGLTAITGETGAGKSIILKALSIALGERTEQDIIRDGEDQAEVSATFDITHNPLVQNWLEEQNINNEEHSIQLRRVILLDKPSKAYINGVAVTASSLKHISDMLIEIQGQNQHRQVTSSSWQQQVLDQWIASPDLLADVNKHFHDIQQLEKQLSDIKSQSVSEYEIDLLNTQIKELETLSPVEDEYAELDSKQRAFHQFQQTRNHLVQSMSLIDGDLDNNQNGIRHLLKDLNYQSSKFIENDEASDNHSVKDSIEQIQALVDDVYAHISHKYNQADIDITDIDKTEKRLSQYFHLSRKHKVAPEFLATLYIELKQKHEQLTHIDEHIAHLESLYHKSLKSYRALATKLHNERCVAAEHLSQQVSEEIRQLGLSHGQFSIAIDALDVIRSHGSDKISFQVSINKGSSAKPIDKAASGGELSRIFLATQIILTQKFSGKTIIYDEIDTGIGGKTASVVGQKLKLLARNYQVICITHLAQVAAFAHQQMLVNKQHGDALTEVSFTQLDKQSRLEELARMLSGDVNNASIKTAEGLLN